MNEQRGSDELRNGRTAPRRAGLWLLGLMVSTMVMGLFVTYQPSSAAPLAQARIASGTVSLSQTASAAAVAPGGALQYSVTIHNGLNGTINISSFTDEYSQGGGEVSTSAAAPGWIGCSDPVGGSTLSCGGGNIAAGGSQTISWPAATHGNAPVGDTLTNQANIVFRLPSDTDDRTAFSNMTSVTIVTPAVPPTHTPAPPPATSTESVQQPPVLPPTDTPVPAGRPVVHSSGRGGDSGGGGHTQPTATPAPAAAGFILGVITRGSAPAPNVPITLHLKSGSGDTQVATARTDANGQYSFSSMPATAAGSGYYVYFASSSPGDMAQWFTYNMPYAAGQLLKLPTFDIADVTMQKQDFGNVSGKVTLAINRRYASETYQLRFAPWNRPATTVLDIGSLGTGNSYTLNTALLPANRYQGLVKVVDSTSGYGFPNNHFVLTVGQPFQAGTPGPGGTPNVLGLTLTSNTTRSLPGGTLIYGIAVKNNGATALTNIVVTFPLISGQTLDIFNTKTTLGSVKAQQSTVMVTIPSLAAGQGANVTIFLAVSANSGVLTNQARASFDQSSALVASNSVSVTVAGSGGQPAPAPATATPTGSGQPSKLPQTGGEFPLWLLILGLALVGVMATVRIVRLRRAA
jgi:uncharacterized repeat protein (TIGR01451 family)/LPXTG-motif cell wall-anchored protein